MSYMTLVEAYWRTVTEQRRVRDKHRSTTYKYKSTDLKIIQQFVFDSSKNRNSRMRNVHDILFWSLNLIFWEHVRLHRSFFKKKRYDNKTIWKILAPIVLLPVFLVKEKASQHFYHQIFQAVLEKYVWQVLQHWLYSFIVQVATKSTKMYSNDVYRDPVTVFFVERWARQNTDKRKKTGQRSSLGSEALMEFAHHRCLFGSTV